MTDLRRAIIVGLLFLIGMMLYNAWTIEHPAEIISGPVNPAASALSSLSPLSVSNSLNSSHLSNLSSLSSNHNLNILTLKNRYITVKTPLIEAMIDRVGGNIVNVKLLKYPVSLAQKNEPVTLLSQSPKHYYIAASGVTTLQNPIFTAAQKNLQVILSYQSPDNIRLIKTYIFSDHDYAISVTHNVYNLSGQPWQGRIFVQLSRTAGTAKGMGPFNFNTYTGAALSSPEKRYQKISFKQMQESNLDQSIQNGWAAMLEHYFLSAWIPDSKETYHYYTQSENNIYTIGFQSPVILLNPQQHYSANQLLYTGPESAEKLAKLAPGLNLTVDYGILWFIADIIFSVMKKIHSVIGNWGWSIVLVTLLIKLLFYKLNSISFQSMARMREMQPKIEQLRERCGDDRQKLAQETMQLYRREKVNPMGGCLPMIVQIPVFLSLYWVIIESVELRQAPFILWIHDLSLKDPYYILPLIMGLTIFIQQSLGPKPADPTQRKVMMMMPVIFTALFLSFPAGLVLYWVVNNTLSILQQWYIMKHVVPKSLLEKNKTKNKIKSKVPKK